jgi:hypothetical protein
MPFDPANLTKLAARHQRLMQIRYGQESIGIGTDEKLRAFCISAPTKWTLPAPVSGA